MDATERHLLLLAIANIKKIGDTRFNGNIYDNMSNIFCDLPQEQRDVILKEFAFMYYIINDNPIPFPGTVEHPITHELPTVTTPSVTWEERNPETYNKNELIRLKSFFIKTLIISIFAAILIVVGVIVLMPSASNIAPPDPNATTQSIGLLASLMEFFKLIFGIGS